MIPTYNQSAFIREAIDSALGQSYSNIEVIVGDDASTDETAKLIAEINDPRLKYVRNQVNMGRVTNYRNILYNHASGDFVVNLDGDDFYTDPDFIVEAVRLIGNDKKVVMVVARAGWEILNNVYVSNIPDVKEASGLHILKNLPDKKYLLKHMASLYNREVALQCNFYSSNSNSSDWEGLYRLSLRGKVKYLDKKIGVWRIHDRNESATTNYHKMMDNLSIWPIIYKDSRNYGLSSISAGLNCARCVAFFASSFATNVSVNGNKELIKFIINFFHVYKISSLLIVLTPRYAARIILSLCGYYRKK